LHHLPDPLLFWDELKRLVKLFNRATKIFIMDLFRPESIQKAKEIVDTVSGNEPEILKKDFYHSLLASFTVNEIQNQLKQSKMRLKVEQVSERHFIIKGILKFQSKNNK
jgi:hypothetical protein